MSHRWNALVSLPLTLLLAVPVGASAVRADDLSGGGEAAAAAPIPLRVMTPTDTVRAGLQAAGISSLSAAFPALDPEAAYTPGPMMGVLASREGGSATGRTPAPTTFRTLAIVVDFTDEPGRVDATFFDTLLFGTTGSRTVNRYYSEASYGLLDIVTLNLPSALGRRRAPQAYSYYVAGNYCISDTYPRNCQRLAEDLTAAVDPVVDFSQYDNDGDGWVDTVFIIHAGSGAEFTGSRNDVWSHSWGTYTGPAYDGVRVGSYTIEPEYWQYPGDMTHGVYVHELGHALGLPDLYDYDGSSSGVGRWSLMAGGSWNGDHGDTPALFDAWSRLYLGFNEAVVEDGLPHTIELPSVQDHRDDSVVRLDGANPQEYWLLENRRQIGSDAALPSGGLLIWHVDEAAVGNDAECRQADNHLCSGSGRHFLVALEQADGLYQLENGTNQGNAGDPFPGSTDKRRFDFGSNPNTSSYYAATDLGVRVTEISDAAGTMTARVAAGDLPAGPFAKTTPTDGAAGRPLDLGLSWEAAPGATGYEYCVDPVDDGVCAGPWVGVGTATEAVLTGLEMATTYFWQVRATIGGETAYADGGAWWVFTTGGPPGAFGKVRPADGATGLPPGSPAVWGPASGADSYEYCYDTVEDGVCNGSWSAAGTATSGALSGLDLGTTYYWQVRATNAFGTTYADGGTWWPFTTGSPPAAFGKGYPADGAGGEPLHPTLSWAAAPGAASYQYCYDDDGAGACSGTWTTLGTATSVVLGPLAAGTTYFWQVRALNAFGYTEADGGAWWSFATPQLQQLTVGSNGAGDGWVLERADDSGKGSDVVDALGSTARLGDDATDRQYRSVLDFDTSALPDGAVVTGLTLRIKRESITGVNPFTSFGFLKMEVATGYFHGDPALERFDFHAVGRGGVGRFISTPAEGWYRAVLRFAAYDLVSPTGSTQFRLRFARDDDDDQTADYLSFYTGDAPAEADRPQLTVTYYVP